MKPKTLWVAAATLMGLPLMVAAQSRPADPDAAAPVLKYQSAFSDYKPWQEIQPSEWRAVNDTVRDAKPGGGHAGHGTATATPPPAAPRAVPGAPPASAGHSGHGAHK